MVSLQLNFIHSSSFNKFADDHLSTDYSSCLVYQIVAKFRGNVVNDGIYPILVGSDVMDVYCDMQRDGGGWTLIVTSASYDSWNGDNVVERNKESPSLEENYSILNYADDIKDTGIGDNFQVITKNNANEVMVMFLSFLN